MRTSQFPTTPESGFSWPRVARLFVPHRARVSTVTGLVVFTGLLGIVNPLLIKRVFDTALFDAAGPNMGRLWTLTSIMLGVTLATGALGVAQTILTNRLGQQVLADLRNQLFAHLQTLSLRFYGAARTGDLQSRLSSDIGGVQTAVTTTLSSILSNLVSLASAVIAMFVLSWQLTLVTLCSVPLFIVATRIVGRRREAYTGETQAATADMNVVTQESLSVSGITLAKLFARQDDEVNRFRDANARLSAAATRQQVIGQSFFTVVQTFLGATPVIVYLVVGLLLNGGTSVSAGTVVAFTTLQTRLFFPIARLLETTVELQSSRAMFRRIFTYIDTEPDIVEAEHPIDLPADQVTGVLTFDNVTFSYTDADAPAELDESDRELADVTNATVLYQVSFTARPGSLVAFVGSSGAGKSTILNLVARLYDPTSGSIAIDGLDLRDLSFATLSRTVGMVTQESYLFAGSLRDNIAYGRPDATDTEIHKAAQAAAIHDRIMDFDEGYDTVVGERGFRLSGGERQRVAIARVLLYDPRVLVLDEATSSLDSASERRIQAALGELISGRTTIAVAHRLSTIQAADVIHVVERGQIVESGTHEALLAAGGAYRRLFAEQFGDGEIETECADGTVWKDGRCGPRRDDGTTHRCIERTSGESASSPTPT